MLIIDDYFDGKIYLGQDRHDLRNVLPNQFSWIVDRHTEFPSEAEGWIHIGAQGTPLDLYLGSIEEEEIISYLVSRNALNALVAV